MCAKIKFLIIRPKSNWSHVVETLRKKRHELTLHKFLCVDCMTCALALVISYGSQANVNDICTRYKHRDKYKHLHIDKFSEVLYSFFCAKAVRVMTRHVWRVLKVKNKVVQWKKFKNSWIAEMLKIEFMSSGNLKSWSTWPAWRWFKNNFFAMFAKSAHFLIFFKPTSQKNFCENFYKLFLSPLKHSNR